ncbi:hypothetical protein LIS44_13955 [Acinetobacter haemolyticus]|jgi:hypothetical protein|uniref:hypothetical protein n=1 Tax=unclassified Acinetobacter TaxID=196816 RepID=UPI0015D192B0|nr:MULTISPECIES: hypothetical protein [unclassified Acinetobacter]MDD2945849.1 hypothetical protein [Acinetobacter sp.]UDM38093.1 hypothetical protein LIS44_13955 [Acinetobacter haemolyticus]
MNLIEHEPHFWELYQDFEHYYLSIAVDMSSVVSCWDLVLTQDEILAYKQYGRKSIEELAKSMVAAAYKGDFSVMESRLASSKEKQAMQAAFKQWRVQ